MKRRIIAFLCILSMCMSLVTPAMAADVNTPEDEVTVENETEVIDTETDEEMTDEVSESVMTEETEQTAEDNITSGSAFLVNPCTLPHVDHSSSWIGWKVKSTSLL